VEKSNKDLAIVIPSMSRARMVYTTKVTGPLPLVVPESQAAEYRDWNPGCEVITHPDSIKGLAPKRQWICEKFGDVFMIDDDIVAARRLCTSSGQKGGLTKEEAVGIIRHGWECAKQAGAYLWCFNHVVNGVLYESHVPIALTGFANGCAHGIRAGSGLNYVSDAVGVDGFYISGLNAHKHRILWKDLRFTFQQAPTMTLVGGQAEWRTMESEKADTLFLRRMFGEAVRIKREIKHGPKCRPIHPYARTMVVPF